PGPEAVAKTEDVHLFKMQIEKSKTEKVKALLSSRAEKLRRSETAASRRPSAIYDQHFHDFMDSITPIDSEGHEQLSASATLDLYKPQ
ncbi:hypothetical protein, partial [Tamilnaduibacter salinus]|uniref:hypothetical protein n=1 Tax=Tamilnaduibacter salinus TaxID=1484056 RepID=UPI001B80E088